MPWIHPLALALIFGAPASPLAPVSKVQLHVHSARSGDSKTPVDQVARWYRARGFDAIVLTDHEVLAAPPPTSGIAGIAVLPGAELTQNVRGCVPSPDPRTFCPLHVNALLIEPTPLHPQWPQVPERARRYANAIRLTRQLGGVPQINHPNFHYAIDAPTIVQLARTGPLLLEVRNEAVDSENAGDATHPSTEALWDQVLSAGVDVWGTATDDAHHYDDAAEVRARGEVAHTGARGWVMVRAAPTAAALRAALLRGDFYASTGVELSRWGVVDGALHVEAAGAADRVRFIGPGGAVLQATNGRKASFSLKKAAGGYVRAVVNAGGAHAWTQPIRVTSAGRPRPARPPASPGDPPAP